jgi:hypothetical protein
MEATATEASNIAWEIISRIHKNSDILYNEDGERDEDIDQTVFRYIRDVLMETSK